MVLFAQFSMQKYGHWQLSGKKTTSKTKQIKKNLKPTKTPPKPTTPLQNFHKSPGFGWVQALPTFSFESSVLSLCFYTQKEQIPEIPQDQLLLKFHTVGGMLSMATHCTMGRCKLPCLHCQLWKQKPALKIAATTLTLTLEKHSMVLEKPLLFYSRVFIGWIKELLKTVGLPGTRV